MNKYTLQRIRALLYFLITNKNTTIFSHLSSISFQEILHDLFPQFFLEGEVHIT